MDDPKQCIRGLQAAQMAFDLHLKTRTNQILNAEQLRKTSKNNENNAYND